MTSAPPRSKPSRTKGNKAQTGTPLPPRAQYPSPKAAPPVFMRKPQITDDTPSEAYAEMRRLGESITVQSFRAKLGNKGGIERITAFLRRARMAEEQSDSLTTTEIESALNIARTLKADLARKGELDDRKTRLLFPFGGLYTGATSLIPKVALRPCYTIDVHRNRRH